MLSVSQGAAHVVAHPGVGKCGHHVGVVGSHTPATVVGAWGVVRHGALDLQDRNKFVK